ncbi:MAG: Hsp20/alpha crystallin family protein [Chitinispirillales bacterium]|nr:Hsp20/alpha crystallin family protein [Chitinispirillales bacterium]
MRLFTLPENVDAEKVGAKMANGVLELSLPKNKAAQPIEVKIS